MLKFFQDTDDAEENMTTTIFFWKTAKLKMLGAFEIFQNMYHYIIKECYYVPLLLLFTITIIMYHHYYVLFT